MAVVVAVVVVAAVVVAVTAAVVLVKGLQGRLVVRHSLASSSSPIASRNLFAHTSKVQGASRRWWRRW
jgi:hypothetical protein